MSLLKNILLGKQYIGIEFFSLNNEGKIAFLQADRNKNGLVIAKSFIFNAKEDLFTEKTKLPAALVINNAQVLQKEIQATDPNDKKLLHKAFPNLQLDEFYYEIWRKDSLSLISICRKSYIDELATSLKDNFNIASISLGLSSLSNLTSFSISSILTTNTQLVYLNSPENIIQPGEAKPSLMDINGLQISNQYLLGFSGILKFMLPESTTGSIQDNNLKLIENFKQNSFFEKILKGGIGLILCLLLVNFLLFTYYFDKATESEETVTLNKAGIQNLVKIKERIKNKEAALKSFTGNSTSRSSLLINNIAKDVPSTILLSEIDYHPLEKKVKTEEPVITLDKIISISGNTISNEDFTAWIENLGKQTEIKNVTIVSFGKDQEGKTIFTIKITLNETE